MYKTMKRCLVPLALAASALVFATSVKAATSYYFDVNGSTSGSGVVADSTNTWEGTHWSTASAGNVATIAWVDGGFPRFSATPDAAGTYTVTCASDHTVAGMYQSTGSANTVNINGPGKINIASGLQGFYVRSGCSFVINV
jgi:hypothetical protein